MSRTTRDTTQRISEVIGREERAFSPRAALVRIRSFSNYSLVFWSAFLVSVTSAFVRERSLFRVPHYAWGDSAVNSLLVLRAEHLRQYVGNYSRVGFHHPGPGFIDMLAAGEVIFKDVLHVVPAPYNGQLLGVSVYVSLFLSLSVMSLCRMTRSVGVSCLAFGLTFLFAVRQSLFANDWFPVLYTSAFLLLIVAGAGLAAGRTSDLPCFVLAGGALVHGHVSYLLFVGVTSAIAGTSWYWLNRRSLYDELRSHRAAVVGAAVLGGLFLFPMLLEIVLHFPGPWHQYWTYLGHTKLQHRTTWQVAQYEWGYWKDLRLPLLLYPLAISVGVVFTATESDIRLRRVFIAIYGIVLLESVLTFYYLLHGVDILTPRSTFGYVGYFYKTVPLVLLIAAAAQLWLRFRHVSRDRSLGPSGAGTAFVALFAAALTLVGATSPRLGQLNDPQAEVVPIVNALREDPSRAQRAVALVEDDLSDWPAAAAVAIQMQRIGLPWCLWQTSPLDLVLYTSTYLCSAKRGALWRVDVTQTVPHAKSEVLWRGPIGNAPDAVIYTQ